MNTRMFGIFPMKYSLDVLVSEEEQEKELFSYFKSMNNHSFSPKFFIVISNEAFPGQKITFLKAKIVVRPGNFYFSEYVAKQLALDLGRSIGNLQSFIKEEEFLRQSDIIK